jgi:hypothetical protein
MLILSYGDFLLSALRRLETVGQQERRRQIVNILHGPEIPFNKLYLFTADNGSKKTERVNMGKGFEKQNLCNDETPKKPSRRIPPYPLIHLLAWISMPIERRYVNAHDAQNNPKTKVEFLKPKNTLAHFASPSLLITHMSKWLIISPLFFDSSPRIKLIRSSPVHH